MRVNKTQLSDILGVSHVTLTEWQVQGLPISEPAERKGQSHWYETADVIAWMIKRELMKANAEGPRDRLARLQADEVEMRLLERQGLLVAVDQIKPAWMAMVASARGFLRSESDRLAHLLESVESLEGKRDLLSETFDEFLTKLSTFDAADDADIKDSTARSGEGGLPKAGPSAEDFGSDLG